MLSSKLRYLGRPAQRWHRQFYQLHQHTARLSTTPDQQSADEREYELTITKDEAISYLEVILEIPDPVSSLERSKVDFLQEVQRRTRMTQPYTNIIYADDDGPVLSNYDHTKRVMMAKQGGGCTQLNHFTSAVLDRMGFNLYPVGASMSKERSRMYQNHTGIVVKELTGRDSLHLVDPGTIHPILSLIPLDFARVSPVYQLASYPIRFFRDCPGILKLCYPAVRAAAAGEQKWRTDPNVYFEDGMSWRPMLTYHMLQPTSWENSYQSAISVTKNRHLVPGVHAELVVFGFSGGLWTVIRGGMFAQYKDGKNISNRKLMSNEEVIENTQRHFPQYSEQDLHACFKFISEN